MQYLKSSLLLFAFITSLMNGLSQSLKKRLNHKPNNQSRIWINAKKTICNAGMLNKECYLVKLSKDQKEWTFFSDEIAGFTYQEGYEYELIIKTEKIKNPPMDASNLKYSLVKIVNKKSVSNSLELSNQWIIASINEPDNIDKPVSKSSFITINEMNNSFSGNGGCNKISGVLTVSGGKIKFGKIISTRMMCDNIEQENKFIKALETTTHYKIIGAELFLYNGTIKLMTLESYRD
jgi:heat shock protein HslJ